MGDVFVGDVGTIILLDTGVDLTGFSTLEIRYKKPGGTTGAWTASQQDTTKAKYTVQAGDLDEEGLWTFQVYAELPSWSGHGEVFTEKIYPVEVT